MYINVDIKLRQKNIFFRKIYILTYSVIYIYVILNLLFSRILFKKKKILCLYTLVIIWINIFYNIFFIFPPLLLFCDVDEHFANELTNGWVSLHSCSWSYGIDMMRPPHDLWKIQEVLTKDLQQGNKILFPTKHQIFNKNWKTKTNIDTVLKI